MIKALNEQLSREFKAHFIYRAIAMDLFNKGYDGFAKWMETHAREEYGHADRLIAYLLDKDVRVNLPAVEKPKESWPGVLEAIESALAHEKTLTEDIHKLSKLADEEGDLATAAMLEWFVSEQVEEEHVVRRLVKRIKLAGNSDIGLVVIDGELGGSAAPAPATGA